MLARALCTLYRVRHSPQHMAEQNPGNQSVRGLALFSSPAALEVAQTGGIIAAILLRRHLSCRRVEGVKSPRTLFGAQQPIWQVKAMTNYETIRSAIQDTTTVPSWAIQGHYVTDPSGSQRTFLAYVLGRSHAKGGGQHDSVLGYQYAGPNTANDDAKKWRCFKVDSFSALIRVS